MRLTRRWRQACFVALGVAGIVPPVLGASPARAQATQVFSAVAVAAPARVQLASDSFPLVQTIGASLPEAQALLDSLGQSRSYAGAPYPGDSVVAVPGLVASLGLPFVPPYPLIAQTEAPTTTHDELAQGPISLVADAGTDAASASASIEAEPAAASATASIAVDGDQLRVDAASSSAALDLGADVRVGSVQASASAVLGPDGSVQLSSNVVIDALRVGPLTIGLGPDGATLLGNVLPLPLELDDLLAPLGISITYLAEQPDPDGRGIVSAGLRITQVIEGALPTPVTVTATLGQARVAVAGTAIPARSTPTTLAPPPTTSAPRPAEVPSVPRQAPPPAAPPPVATPAPAAAVSAQPVAAIADGFRLREFDLVGFYLMLVLAGVAVAGAGRSFRHVGVADP